MKNSIIGYAASGKGTVKLRQLQGADGGVIGSASNLTESEFDAYQKAKLVADKRNQGDMSKAIALLENAGFEIFWN